MIEVEIIQEVTDELLEAFVNLMPQLSENKQSPTRLQLEEIVASAAVKLLVARDTEQGGRMVGTLTLVIYRTPAGISSHIEDVVVDKSVRGKGIGEILTRYAIEMAASLGANKVDLTSAPWREAANRLYQRLGFVQWETNFYRYVIKPKN